MSHTDEAFSDSINKKNVFQGISLSITIFVLIIFGLFLVGFISLSVLFGIDNPNPGLINPIFSTKEIVILIIGFILILTGIGIRIHKSKAFTTESTLYTIICSLILGFFFYLCLVKIQPKPLFTSPPTEEWWVALSILAVLFVGFFALEFVKIRDVYFLKKEMNERIDNLEDYKSIHESIYDDYAGEGLAAKDRWKKSYLNIQKIKNQKIIDSSYYRVWSLNAWNEGVVDIAIALRRDAYHMDKNNDWNKLFYANILVDEEDSLDLEFKNIRKILSDIPESRSGEFAFMEHILGKLHWRKNQFDLSVKHFNQSCLADDSFTYRFYYLLSLVLAYLPNTMNHSQSITEAYRLFYKWEDEASKRKWNHVIDDKSYEPAKLMIKLFIEKDEETQQQYFNAFYRCFSPLKSLEFSSVPFIDRYSLPSIYARIQNEDFKLVYLTFYKFFGALDKEADEIIYEQNGNMLDKIEINILKSWKFEDRQLIT